MADAVVVVMQRSLADVTTLHPLLQDCLHKLLDIRRGQCPIFLFSALDEKSKFGNAKGLNTHMQDFKNQKKENFDKSHTELKRQLKQKLKRDGINKDEQEKQAEKMMKILEKNMFSSWPLLWTSLTLSPGEGSEALGANVRANCLGLLEDFGRLVCALKGQPGKAQDVRVVDIMTQLFRVKCRQACPASFNPTQGRNSKKRGKRNRGPLG